MCCQNCRISHNYSLTISKNHFNQFNNTMIHFNRSKSIDHAKNNARNKLTNYLAQALKVCPRLVTSKIANTIVKSSF
jgi:hypothetical protein